jgi:SAM-dependent methyltransferase
MIYSDDLAYIHHAGFEDFTRQAAPEIARLLRRRFRQKRPTGQRPLVIELGCGGGSLVRDLSRRGFRVLGIDQSPAMIRIARDQAPGAAFKVGTLAAAAIPRCEAIVALGEVVNYLPGRGVAAVRRHDARLFHFFDRAARALTRRGLLLFDFMESADGRTFDGRGRTGRDWAIVTRAEANGRILTREMTTFRKVGRGYRRSREIHHVRLYDRETIGAALGRAGFAVTMRRSIGRVRLMRGAIVAIAALQ